MPNVKFVKENSFICEPGKDDIYIYYSCLTLNMDKHDLWWLPVAIVSVSKIYLVSKILLSQIVIAKLILQDFSHINALTLSNLTLP